MTHSSVRLVPFACTTLVDAGVGTDHTFNTIWLFVLFAWVADTARVTLGADADQVPNLRKEQDEIHYGRKGMKRCIYPDIFHVLSNFDGRPDDLMTNHLRIVDFAPAGAHGMLRGESAPKRW